MKNLLALSTAIIMTLGLAGVGTTAIAAEQMTSLKNQVSKAVASAQSKISLEQAIVIGNKSIKGDLVSVKFRQADSLASGTYEIKTIASDIEYQITIDADTGEMLSAEQDQLDTDDMAEYRAMKRAKTSLTQAIKNAKQIVNGQVVAAEFDVDYGKPVYKIKIATKKQLHKVVVDSMTGKIINNRIASDNNDDD